MTIFEKSNILDEAKVHCKIITYFVEFEFAEILRNSQNGHWINEIKMDLERNYTKG